MYRSACYKFYWGLPVFDPECMNLIVLFSLSRVRIQDFSFPSRLLDFHKSLLGRKDTIPKGHHVIPGRRAGWSK